MLIDKSKATDVVAGTVQRSGGAGDAVKAGGVFTIRCHDESGNLKWEAESHNLVVNVGLKDMNDTYFRGISYTATWFLGIYGASASNGPAAGNTAASHSSFTEVTAYSNAVRPTATFAAASTADPSVITNSASPGSFSINGTTTVGGAFLISNSTKGGTTGILFSAADFSSPGDRAVVSGDTLTVTYTFSLDAV